MRLFQDSGFGTSSNDGIKKAEFLMDNAEVTDAKCGVLAGVRFESATLSFFANCRKRNFRLSCGWVLNAIDW
jgi:hypothetical protein